MSERFSAAGYLSGFEQAGRRLEVLRVSTLPLLRVKPCAFGAVGFRQVMLAAYCGAFGKPVSGNSGQWPGVANR